MKFRITTTNSCYWKHQIAPLEKLGFTFEEREREISISTVTNRFTLMMRKEDFVDIEIASLEELVELARTYDSLIITAFKDVPEIEIYDDERE